MKFFREFQSQKQNLNLNSLNCSLTENFNFKFLFKSKVEKFHTVNNQNLAVKKALPKDQTNSGSGNMRGGNMNGGNYRNQSRNENPRFNDFNEDFTNNNNFNGGGFNNFNSNGAGSNNGLAGNLPGMGNFANFAMIAQKMIQAAAMGNGIPGNMAQIENNNGFNRNNQGQSKRKKLKELKI